MKRRREESGYALLLVFLLAAGIAISLYMEMPRVAFESQRAREQLSIDRAMQYERAIQLYYRKYRTYPQTLDDLETTHNIRFLRQRYKDPLTGKDFRLLHVGPNGQLLDSLVTPANPLQPGAPGANATAGGSSPTAASTSASNSTPTAIGPDGQPIQPFDPLNMAARRPSDRLTPTGTGQPGAQEPDQEPQPEPGQTGQPQPVYPGQPGYTGQPGQPAYPGQPGFPTQIGQPGQPVYPGQPGFPGQPVTPVLPAQPGDTQDPSQTQQQYPNQQPYPGQPTPYPGQPTGAPPGVQPTPFSPFQNQNPAQTYNPFPQNPGQIAGQPIQGAPGTPQPLGGAAQQNQAANLIQQLLTTPRQPPPSVAGISGGNLGGIAGVASNAEGKGIHVVNDHSKYKEWEFVYDIKKDKTAVGNAAVQQQQFGTQGVQSPLGASPLGAGASPISGSTSGTSTAGTPGPSAAPTAPPPSN
ncbi:MAG TPA: hypothetical protein VMH80_05535 [Bryobacteraceae bacterium]|nr:hypothetical protein [Bryobacteraceae bacterium]